MKQRNLNADLIRSTAVFFVLSVHFFLNSEFYNSTVQGEGMLLMLMARSLFMTCVPLFMILSGYLMWKKEISRSYYKGIIKTLEIYVLASIACLLYKNYVLHDNITLRSALLGILDFDAANYAWYIEMYISLFLLIPFLNRLYHSLKNKKEKQLLLITLLIVTMLPHVLNNFNFTTEGWWSLPSATQKYDPLVPGFFKKMYPLTYYYIGVYLREFDWKLSKKKNFLLLLGSVMFFGLYNFYRSRGSSFVWGTNCDWGGENVITATLLFTFLLHLHVEQWPKFFQHILIYVSRISLGIYLVSWIADQIVYSKYLLPNIPMGNLRWACYPVVVGSVFLISVLIAFVLYWIRDHIRSSFSIHRH